VNKTIDIVEHLIALCGDTMQGVRIGFERVSAALRVDDSLAFEGQQQLYVIAAKEQANSVQVLSVQRCLIKAAQRQRCCVALADHRHAAEPVVAEKPLPPASLGKRVLAQEAAEPFGRYTYRFGSLPLIACSAE
jgi:hypothetical protein